MSKRDSESDFEAIQLCLPRTGILDFGLDPDAFHECECQGCPPWVHSMVLCARFCADWRVPPTSNTGVHDPRRTAVSDSSLVLPDSGDQGSTSE